MKTAPVNYWEPGNHFISPTGIFEFMLTLAYMEAQEWFEIWNTMAKLSLVKALKYISKFR